MSRPDPELHLTTEVAVGGRAPASDLQPATLDPLDPARPFIQSRRCDLQLPAEVATPLTSGLPIHHRSQTRERGPGGPPDGLVTLELAARMDDPSLQLTSLSPPPRRRVVEQTAEVPDAIVLLARRVVGALQSLSQLGDGCEVAVGCRTCCGAGFLTLCPQIVHSCGKALGQVDAPSGDCGGARLEIY